MREYRALSPRSRRRLATLQRLRHLLWFLGYSLLAPLPLVACGDGTSGWVLNEKRLAADGPSAGGSGANSAGGAGAATNGGSGVDFSGVCSPEVVVENRDASGNGSLFDQAVPEAQPTVLSVTRATCSILYRSVTEVPARTKISLVIDDFDGVGMVGVGEQSEIQISSTHLRNTQDIGSDVRDEIIGMLHFLSANIYEHRAPDGAGWAASGVADFVRYQAGYLPLSKRERGGSYTDGYAIAGFFFAWIEQRYPGFAYRLNQSLNPNEAWSTDQFVTLTGKSVDTLWTEYQATL